MANGHGGARRGAGRPMGRRNLRPHGTILAAERAEEGLIPVEFEGDSLDFLRATMQGKIWPTREQIYAAKSVLPIEHPPAPYSRWPRYSNNSRRNQAGIFGRIA
jgi:hypothetical protein